MVRLGGTRHAGGMYNPVAPNLKASKNLGDSNIDAQHEQLVYPPPEGGSWKQQAAQCVEAVLQKVTAAESSGRDLVSDIDVAWIQEGQALAHKELGLASSQADTTRREQTPDVDWIGLQNRFSTGRGDAHALAGTHNQSLGGGEHAHAQHDKHRAYTGVHYSTLCTFGSALRDARHHRRRQGAYASDATADFGYAAKVVVFGGSMTYGENSNGCPTSKPKQKNSTHTIGSNACAWPALLQHWFDIVYGAGLVEVVNLASRGKNLGWLSMHANELTAGMAAEGKPTLFLLDFSVNDALGVGGYKGNTTALVEKGRVAAAKLAPGGGVVLLQTWNSACRTGTATKKERLAAGVGKCQSAKKRTQYSMPDGYQQISTGVAEFPMPLWQFNKLKPLTTPHPTWLYHAVLAEGIGAVLAATDACSPGAATATATATATAAGPVDAGKHAHRVGSSTPTDLEWCDQDGGTQSSLSSLGAIGAAAGLTLTQLKDGKANFVGGGSADDCDKTNVEMVSAVHGMQLTPHSAKGPWEPLGYGVGKKSGHSWRVSNVAAAGDTGTMPTGWRLLELRQGKPGWISEGSAVLVGANAAVDEEPDGGATLQFVPPSARWMLDGLRPMRLYVEFMKTYENAGQAEVWYCGKMVAVLDALWTDRVSLTHGESVILPACGQIKSGTAWSRTMPDAQSRSGLFILGRVDLRRRRASAVHAARVSVRQAASKADIDPSATGTAKFKLISVALCTV